MIGKTIQLDEKTMSKVDFPRPVSEVNMELSPAERTGVTVDDLIHAASNGYAMIVRYVLHSGVHPNAKDRFGRTALMVAANREVYDVLIEAGATPDANAA